MSNPIMQLLQRNSQSQPNNPIAMIAEFKKFAAGITPAGAKRQVEQMLASGQMTQEQFQQLKAQAEQFSQFLK